MRYDPAGLFRSTAPYYARYRAGYPREFFAYLAERFTLDGTQRVLDLGCGTGQIALPLAPHAGHVYAIDPEPAMLGEGRRLATDRGIRNIDWISGDSYHLAELDLPEVTLATIGSAFHWMDRDQVLRDLNEVVSAGGAIVIAANGLPADQDPPPWDDIIAAIRARFLGPVRRAGSGTYLRPEGRHEDVLARSPFSRLEKAEWAWSADRDLDALIGLQFSYSYCAPAQFGDEDQRAAFEAELRQELRGRFPEGAYREQIRTEALIATRP